MNQAVLSERVSETVSPANVRQGAVSGVISLDGGLPDPVTHPIQALAVLTGEILAANEPRVMGYGYEMGDERLRAAIAARAAADGASLTADNVVLTNGSSGAIGLTALALLEPGDTVITEALTYVTGLKAFRQMGARIEVAPMDEGGLDPDGLASALRRVEAARGRVKFIYTIATNHNPTGAVLSLERRRAIARLAALHGAMIVQDDTYGDLRFAPAPPPFIALAPEHSVHLGSFSKTIAPGLRVGWAAADASVCAAFARGRTDLGNSSLAQRLVARFIETGQFEPHLRGGIEHYRKKRDRMLAALERRCADLAEWRRPNGGFFLWLRLRRGDVSALRAALDEEKLGVLLGPHFSACQPFMRHLRLAYGQVAEADIEEAVERLARALERTATA